MSKKYDYLIVGAGLFGAVFANRAHRAGKSCIVLEKRNHIAGNAYTRLEAGIPIHQYGAHIFHTGNRQVYEYLSQFTEFNHYVNSPIANYKGEIYNLPFNMNTFHQMWGVVTPGQAQNELSRQIEKHYTENPQNLEEQAINLVGPDIYEKLIKGYTEKQWGRPCTQLPSFIIRRLPLRFTYDNNYFNDPYQGIPVDGYTEMVRRMLEGIEVRLQTDYFDDRAYWESLANRTVYSGPIDAYFHCCYGALQYRSLRFETEVLDCPNYQGNAVVNYTDRETPFTRMIEHKHFTFGLQPNTVITKEYSQEWVPGQEPYYPINDSENSALYEKYRLLTEREPNVLFGGRLAEYRYYDMDQTVERALEYTTPELLSIRDKQ